MKAEHWILSAGAAFVIVVIGAAMIPEDIWEHGQVEPGEVIAGAVGAGGGIVNPALMHPNALGDVVAGQPGAAGAGMPASPSTGTGAVQAAPWGRNAAMPGLIPFTRAASQRFQGTVVSTVTLGSEMGWGQVHIWVADGANVVQEISLAPDWYLSYLGCTVAEQARVNGVAFKFDQVQANVELYAKTITINGVQCGLRNDEGFALWSNQLR
ncbi:MAG: hypothetical protein HQL37_01785 [Alphaproteobacteria bacterium]|nr:hypothetical protein [Alphaproteobacteria bacterium]